MYRTGSAKEIIEELSRYNIQNTALQEIRWPQQGEVKIGSYTILYSGKHDGVHELGVGFCIHDKVIRTLQTFTPINERIAKIRIKCKWFHMSLITAHAPIEDKDDSDKDDFYTCLQEVYDGVQQHDLRIILGDMNAKVGKEMDTFGPAIGKESLHQNCNDNGIRLASLALMNNMIIGGTVFPHKDIHKQTWISPDDRTSNQIDHILIHREHRSALQDVRVFRGAGCDSDHHMVVGKIKAKLQTKRTPRNAPIRKFDTYKLQRERVRMDYRIELNNRFDVLNLLSEGEEEDVNSILKNIEEIVVESAKEIIGHETRRRKEEWYDEECREASREVRRTREKYLRNTDDQESRESLTLCRSRAKRLFKRKKNEHLERELDRIERDREEGKIREHHKRLNAVKKGFQARNWMVKTDDGEIVYGEEEVLNQWLHYFKVLLNRQDPVNPIPPCQQIAGEREGEIENEVEEPSLAETKRSIKELRNNKTPGCDGIPAELLKAGGERELQVPEKLVSLIKACYVDSRWVVKVGEKETEEFEVISGLKQGCILSPTFFNLVMEKAARESLSHPGAIFETENIGLLAYADDVVMIAENMDEINEMFTPFQNTAGQVGLVCNESKTAIMKMSREGGNRGNMQCLMGICPITDIWSFTVIRSLMYT
ncbi:uncharacterized protein LOC143027672 [Oratosquilla oratoria]|uniref:uncharacterized protein LOC143027672 n=1 Tax=Oratosquilla oratoria TaxID=337810 RepID=UPI003F758389